MQELLKNIPLNTFKKHVLFINSKSDLSLITTSIPQVTILYPLLHLNQYNMYMLFLKRNLIN